MVGLEAADTGHNATHTDTAVNNTPVSASAEPDLSFRSQGLNALVNLIAASEDGDGEEATAHAACSSNCKR